MSVNLSETFNIPEIEPWINVPGYKSDPILEYKNT
jgi:hypothetical protein